MTMISPIEVQAIRSIVGQAAAASDDALGSESVAMRQFRHHTKNALQRILCQLSSYAEMRQSAHGRQLIADIEQRIVLSARMSDVLFGFTRAPGTILDRLRILGESMVALLGDSGQIIKVSANIQGNCPAPLHDVVMRVANELLGNAVKHGMYARVIGRIDISLTSGDDGTRLVIADDGWGCGTDPSPGEGLSVARALANANGGTLRVSRHCETTLAELQLPPVAVSEGLAGGQQSTGH